MAKARGKYASPGQVERRERILDETLRLLASASPSDISMDAVKQIMSNTGYPAFNYDVFKRIYDQDGDLKNVVADFDNEKIVVKTDKEAEDNPEMDFDNQGSTDKVKQMAKSAMNRRK